MNERDKEALRGLRGTIRFWQALTGIRIDSPVTPVELIDIQEFVVIATSAPTAIGGLKRLREICEALNS